MNDVIREWMTKSDGDFGTAQRELGVSDAPNLDAVCFHSQQCIEKLMKAVLIALGQVPPRTHDLIVLADLMAAHLPGWQWPGKELRFLSRAAVTFRYPGESAEREDAVEALDIATRLRQELVRRLLTL